MQTKSSFEFIKTMTRYSIGLGFLIGCAGAIPIALTWFDISLLLPVMALFIVITMSGGLVGMVYGAVSGFISGMLMWATTHVIFRKMNQAVMYKVTMGVLALITTLALFLFDFVFIGSHQADFYTHTIAPLDWLAVWFTALVLAVYASQKTATEYLVHLHIK